MAAPININTVIDIAVLAWMTGSVVLLWLFARFGIKACIEAGLKTFYEKISFFIGLICHHIGNLFLLAWYWAHRTQISINITHKSDLLVPAIGMLIATYGVFYKIRVFSYSNRELLIAITISLAMAAVYIFVLV